MGASSENFCLRWNDFESNVSGAFRDLRQEADFFDVTLGCPDGKSLQAHKVILSACSSTFKQMLRDLARSSQNPHPYIFLRGVGFADLQAVLDFMYHGEVNVAQEDLNSFLAVAEELQIKGLTQKEGGGEPSKPKPSSAVKRSQPSETSTPAVKKVRRSSPDPQDVKTIDIKSDPEAGPSGVKAVNLPGSNQDGGASNVDYGDESADFEDYGDYYGDDNGEGGGAGADGSMMEGGEDGAGGKVGEDAPGDDDRAEIEGTPADLEGTPADGTPAEIAATTAGGFVCLVCGRKFNFKTSAVRHYRTQHIAQNRVQCHVCQRYFKNKVVRNTHRAHAHGITENMMRCIVGERPASISPAPAPSAGNIVAPSAGNMVLHREGPIILKRHVVEVKRENIEK